jgi:DNA repair protein RecN (Recombination protein N)
MLTHLRIKDFAIVDEIDVEPGRGLTVLTGETGAGKSILVDAIGLVLGDRADASLVRHGRPRAEISVEFDLHENPASMKWLEEQELDDGGTCLLRRTISSEGRSRAYVNGHKVPLQILKRLGERLMDIHGQHEHQSLLRPAVQLALVDGFGRHKPLLEETARAFEAWREAEGEVARLRDAIGEGSEKLDFLRHQLRELEGLALAPGELESLEEEHERLRHGGRLLEESRLALDAAYEAEEGSAAARLGEAMQHLRQIEGLDRRLEPVASGMEQARIHLEEAAEDLRRYLGELDSDPARLEWVADRIGTAHTLARKHRVEPEALPETLERLRAELESLENADARLDEAGKRLAASREAWLTAARALHESRASAAQRLAGEVTEVMQGLGLSGGRFEVCLEADQDAEPSRRGLDRAEFRVSMNAGQPLRPLAKVASGGELSRIGLAIQVVGAQASTIPAMIFDEVDAGIGGGVAEIVGRELRRLGDRCQVLCVTHLPQVASQGHGHFRIRKEAVDGETYTRVERLEDTARVEELARMLGGTEITETTRSHAREMMERATG